MALVVRRWIQCPPGCAKWASRASRSLSSFSVAFGYLAPVRLLEAVHGRLGGLPVLSVHDLAQRRLGLQLQALGQRVEDPGDLVHPAALLPGLRERLADGAPEPSAPSPTGSTGARIPRRFRSRSTTDHDSSDSR
jgi:hypothetical protein